MLLTVKLHKSFPLFCKSWYLEEPFITMWEEEAHAQRGDELGATQLIHP